MKLNIFYRYNNKEKIHFLLVNIIKTFHLEIEFNKKIKIRLKILNLNIFKKNMNKIQIIKYLLIILIIHYLINHWIMNELYLKYRS